MSYRIRFRARAKADLQIAKQYSTQFSDDLDAWLTEIAASCQRRDSSNSIDLIELLDHGTKAIEHSTAWEKAWKRWWSAAPFEKLKALVVFLRKRCPPWELRATSKWFTGILGAFDCDVCAYYEVNHVAGEVVFATFTGLPGEDH